MKIKWRQMIMEKNNENQYRLNKRFSEGKKVYHVWYNPDLGKFLVISHTYRENYDKYNIMLCASYEEANAFAFCMNKSLLSPIKDRKTTLYHLEKLNEDEKLDRDAQADRILEALKYKATLNKGSIFHEDFCETYYNVKQQMKL